MSDRFNRPFPNSGGNAGPQDEFNDPLVPVNPVPSDIGTPYNQISSRSGNHGITTFDRDNGMIGRRVGRWGHTLKFVRCDNQDAAGRQEILNIPAVVPVWRLWLNGQPVENTVYKVLNADGSEHGCFRYEGFQRGAFNVDLAALPGAAAQCGDCDVDHGQAFTVLDCNNNEIKLSDANGEHGNDFFLNDIIEITVDGAQNSVCVIVGEKFDLNAGEDLGFAYTFSRVIGGQNEDCTACDILTGYIVKKCGTNDNVYIDDPNGNYQAAWVDQVHEFAPNGGGSNYCAEIVSAESGMAIDIQNSNTYTAPGDTWVQLRGGQNDCSVCDDIDGYIIQPCSGSGFVFLAYEANEAALSNGDVYLFTNSNTGVTECYTITQQYSAQETEITAATQENPPQFADGRGHFVRGAQKANCQSCAPVAGCPDSTANNYDAAADGCEVNGVVVAGDTSCCNYPPVNPVNLVPWSACPSTGYFHIGNANQQSLDIYGIGPFRHGAYDGTTSSWNTRWYADPNYKFQGYAGEQTHEGQQVGWYLVRKLLPGDQYEYELAFAGQDTMCGLVENYTVAYLPNQGGVDMIFSSSLKSATAPTNANQVEWEIYDGGFETLHKAIAALLGVTGGGTGKGGATQPAVLLRPCDEYYRYGDPDECWDDKETCYYVGALGNGVVGGGVEGCGVALVEEGDDDGTQPACGNYRDWGNADPRNTFVAGLYGVGSLSVGDKVHIYRGNDPTQEGTPAGTAISQAQISNSDICEVIEVNLKLNALLDGHHISTEGWACGNPQGTDCLDMIRNALGDPQWGANAVYCGTEFSYYKLLVCGDGQVRYLRLNQDHADHPLGIGDVVAFTSMGGSLTGGVGCGTINQTLTEEEFRAKDAGFKVTYLDKTNENTTMEYTDCDDCMNPGGGGGGGGGGGTTIYYEANECVTGQSVELHDINGNGPFSVGNVVVADDNGTYLCVTITADNIDPEIAPTIEAISDLSDCNNCLNTIGGVP